MNIRPIHPSSHTHSPHSSHFFLVVCPFVNSVWMNGWRSTLLELCTVLCLGFCLQASKIEHPVCHWSHPHLNTLRANSFRHSRLEQDGVKDHSSLMENIELYNNRRQCRDRSVGQISLSTSCRERDAHLRSSPCICPHACTEYFCNRECVTYLLRSLSVPSTLCVCLSGM